MAATPTDVVERLYDAFARQDTEAAFGLIDPDVEIEYRGVVPDACGSYHGYAGLGRLLQTILASFEVDRFEVTPEQVIAADDGRVVVGLHQTGTGAASGRSFCATWSKGGRPMTCEPPRSP